jgi:hypothetical protein
MVCKPDRVKSIKWMQIIAIQDALFLNAFLTCVGKFIARNLATNATVRIERTK